MSDEPQEHGALTRRVRSLRALRLRAYEAIAGKGDGSIGMSRSAGQDMLAVVEVVEIVQRRRARFRDGDGAMTLPRSPEEKALDRALEGFDV